MPTLWQSDEGHRGDRGAGGDCEDSDPPGLTREGPGAITAPGDRVTRIPLTSIQRFLSPTEFPAAPDWPETPKLRERAVANRRSEWILAERRHHSRDHRNISGVQSGTKAVWIPSPLHECSVYSPYSPYIARLAVSSAPPPNCMAPKQKTEAGEPSAVINFLFMRRENHAHATLPTRKSVPERVPVVPFSNPVAAIAAASPTVPKEGSMYHAGFQKSALRQQPEKRFQQ